jgi:hypothetical protein
MLLELLFVQEDIVKNVVYKPEIRRGAFAVFGKILEKSSHDELRSPISIFHTRQHRTNCTDFMLQKVGSKVRTVAPLDV